MNNNQKYLKRMYKEKEQKTGIFILSFKNSDTKFIGSSKNLDKVINKHIFQLKLGSHICKSLQREYDLFGEDALEFKIIEEINTKDINPMLIDDVLKSKKNKWAKQLFVVEL